MFREYQQGTYLLDYKIQINLGIRLPIKITNLLCLAYLKSENDIETSTSSSEDEEKQPLLLRAMTMAVAGCQENRNFGRNRRINFTYARRFLMRVHAHKTQGVHFVSSLLL